MASDVRLNAMEIELGRLRIEVHDLRRELEQTRAERDAFMLEVRQQWEAFRTALAEPQTCV